MKKLLAAATAAAAAIVFTACGGDPRTDAFRDGFPHADTVKMTVPGSAATQPLTGNAQRRDGLEGETAKFYSFTRGVTTTVNGSVVWALTLVERITDYQPTTVTADTAVWGPHTEPLSPNTWKFTVTRRAANDYAYQLEGKGKTEADSAFRVVLSGTHTSAGHLLGNGTLLLNWQAASTLPEHDAMVGSGTYTYARPATGSATTIDATFSQVRDGDSGQLVDATYHFAQTPGQGGSLEFGMNKDLTGTSALELLSVRSRWQETGAGRADVRVSGVDLPTAATATECWDTNFASRYMVVSYDPAQAWGTASVCAFNTAEYARP